MPTTYAELILGRSRDDRIGLRFEGRTYTWRQIVDEARLRAAALTSIPLPEGRVQRHVALLLENVPDFVFWMLAVGLSGDVLVGVNPTRRGAELAADIRQTDCDLLITEPRYEDQLASVDLPFPSERVFDIESASYREWLNEFDTGTTARIPDVGAMVLLMFTSGSTGAPKAVVCTQQRLASLAVTLTERVNIRPDSVLYLSMPLFHANSIMMVLNTALAAGATIVMVRRFSASGFVEDLHEHGVTFMNYVGRTINYILATPEDPRDRTSTLELAYGTEASPRDRHRFVERFGCEIREGYGSSEGVLRINPDEGTPATALGRPVQGIVVEIRHEDGSVCEPARFDENGRLLNADAAIGEIVALDRAHLFEGYYRNPEAVAQRLKSGGNDFWTGDLGFCDEDGYIYYAGRTSEWVRIGGENFATAPVERILGRQPDVTGVLAYPVPDPETSDQLMCALQMTAGEQFDVQAFEGWMRAQPDLSPRWFPRFVRVCEAFPLTANGKVDKAPLRKQAWETVEPVWWLPPRGNHYVELTGADRVGLRAQFAANQRVHLAPAPVAADAEPPSHSP